MNGASSLALASPSPVDLALLEECAPLSPEEAAEEAGLRYVSDSEPGLTRVRAGRGFRYLDRQRRPLTDGRALDRIRALVIPPAWNEVWISPWPNGHIQATGRDARGRKQYLYHAEWRRVRDESKFQQMLVFGASLPAIRERVDDDLRAGTASREQVLAGVVRLLDKTAIRVGNDQYARENDSYGLTTLRPEHVHVEGTRLRLHFRGKGGKEISLAIKDRRVAAMVRRLQELPGQELFRYKNGNGIHPVDSGDVNAYLKAISGQDFTAKDFRTWTASVLAAQALVAIGPADSKTGLKRNLNAAVDEAARQLGNTRTVCRQSYVHPAVFDAYTDGWLAPVWIEAYQAASTPGLHPEEVALLAALARAAAEPVPVLAAAG